MDKAILELLRPVTQEEQAILDGRHIVGWREQGQIRTREVYRFPNGLVERDGHLVWDPRRLFSQVVRGLLEAFRAFPEIESLSIDTWGVDYVLLKDDRELYPVYAYRDRRTERVIPKVHEKNAVFGAVPPDRLSVPALQLHLPAL